MKPSKIIIALIIIASIATAIVIALFVASEDIIHHRNNFVRRFSDQVEKNHEINLKYNSFYFAGEDNENIYLGNYSGPLLLTTVDKKLNKLENHTMQINRMELPFRSVEVRVKPPHFFLFDGTVPCIFKGKLETLQAKFLAKPQPSFSRVQVIDSTTFVYCTNNKKGETVLGLSKMDGTNQINPLLLQKQIDGNFDVDGTLLYDAGQQTVVYLYLYRNQFIVTKPDLSLMYRGKTIDTVAKAQIKVAYIKSLDATKMAAPPLIVNQTATVYNGLLFVNSKLIGKYEDIKIWDQASVVDVYDLKDGSYIASLYIYNIGKSKMRTIYASGKNLYAIIGNHLVSYKLTELITKHYVKNR